MNQSVPGTLQMMTPVGPFQLSDSFMIGVGEDWIVIGISGLIILLALMVGHLKHCLSDAILFSVATSLIVFVLVLIA